VSDLIPRVTPFQKYISSSAHKNWNRNYQQDVQASLVVIREQSKDPEVATAALRTFAEWMGRGFAPVVKKMTLVERQNDALLRIFAQPGVAQRIRMGLNQQLIDMDDIPPEVPVHVPEPRLPVFPKKRKRKPPDDLSKFEFRLQDFDSDDDLLQLRRRPFKRKRKPSPKRGPPSKRKRKGARPAWMGRDSSSEEQKMQPTPKRRRVAPYRYIPSLIEGSAFPISSNRHRLIY
jgi:hypothetical protein